MPSRLIKLVTRHWARTRPGQVHAPAYAPSYALAVEDVVWAMGSFCALNRTPFDGELLVKQFPPPYSADSFIHAARALGFKIKRKECAASALASLHLPCLVLMRAPAPPATANAELDSDAEQDQAARPAPRLSKPAIVIQATADTVVFFEAGTNTPKTLSVAEFTALYTGSAFQLALETKGIKDPDGAKEDQSKFGFRWFIPELLKHKRVWRDVLIASLVIQLLALGTPLFTQVVIDKVVVHRTQSTLFVIAIGLGVFMLFSALLSWVRQYLVLHTGNRVDAVLGSAVFNHLFKLPPRYFEHRPTGVIAARLHGVETIREFVASAAVTLILDCPFLLIFVGIMFYYSVTLTPDRTRHHRRHRGA